MLVLALDPGKSTGYAMVQVIDRQMKLIDIGVEKDEQVKYIGELILQADVVICEDFKIRPNMARAGNFDYDNMVAPRVIGKIELLCQMGNKELVKQQASLKPMGFAYMQLRYVKGKKGTHAEDALSHAGYYLVKNQLALPLKHALSS